MGYAPVLLCVDEFVCLFVSLLVCLFLSLFVSLTIDCLLATYFLANEDPSRIVSGSTLGGPVPG